MLSVRAPPILTPDKGRVLGKTSTQNWPAGHGAAVRHTRSAAAVQGAASYSVAALQARQVAHTRSAYAVQGETS